MLLQYIIIVCKVYLILIEVCQTVHVFLECTFCHYYISHVTCIRVILNNVRLTSLSEEHPKSIWSRAHIKTERPVLFQYLLPWYYYKLTRLFLTGPLNPLAERGEMQSERPEALGGEFASALAIVYSAHLSEVKGKALSGVVHVYKGSALVMEHLLMVYFWP